MALESGSQLGHYEITEQIGKGGMGEVYRARDTKLGREVAIKVLPSEFSQDAERLARLEREARMLAALNHPNIAAIHGLEESDDTRFLVLELVEGDTLADRLKRGAVPVEESLKLALQVAEALEAAHEKGVIHRDLKPANIKITPEGRVKVLDFGLAKAFLGDQADVNLSNSPTLSMAATQAGMILGTAAYMSPEQASGETADHRSDVWSFGVVLFEILTGQQLFTGKTASHVMGAVLNIEPEWARLPANLHPRIRVLLERSLEKEAKDRLSGISDARVEIQKALVAPDWAESLPPAVPEPVRGASVLTWAAAIILTALAAASTVWLLTPGQEFMVTRFDDVLPDERTFRNQARPFVTISKDGSQFVYNGSGGLYLRAMGEREARLIPGTESPVTNPVFSPDGEWLAFWSGGDQQIKKIAVVGGAPVSLTNESGNPLGVSWDTDEAVLYARPDGTIARVSSDGGTPENLVTPSGSASYSFPQFLPGGEAILSGSSDGVVRVHLPGEEARDLFPGFRPRYTSTGHIVYAQNGVLFAVAFDASRIEVVGGPVPLIEGVQGNPPQYAISDAGNLVYVPGTAAAGGTEVLLAFVDETGRAEIVDDRPAEYRYPRISPDGSRIAVEIIGDAQQSSVWIYDLTDEEVARTRLTLPSEGNNTNPVWTPDGEFVAFWSDRDGEGGIYLQRADGTGAADRLTTAEDGNRHLPEAWTPDGDILSFARVLAQPGAGAAYELWTVSVEGEREAQLYYDLPISNQFGTTFSPDGEWIAYSSGETSSQATEFGVYAERFPDRSDRREVARDGASWPVWSGDNRIIYRLSTAQEPTLMSVDVLASEPTLRFTEARTFPVPNLLVLQGGRDYDVTPDGRLLMIVPAGVQNTGGPRRRQVNVVLNWFEELKERVPVP